MPPSRIIELLIPRVLAAPTGVLLAGQPAADAWRYDAANQTLHVRMRWQHQPLTISIQGLRLTTTASTAAPELLTLGAPSDRVFNDQTTLNYTVHTPGQYPLTIRDARGHVVRTLTTASTPGEHSQVWNTKDQNGQPLPNGVYTAQMLGQHQRLVLLRPEL
jgi:hypothetical protein